MSRLNFGITVDLPYETLGLFAREQFVNSTVEVGPGVTLKIEDLALKPRGDQVEVRIRFAVASLLSLLRKSDGNLVLLGSPHFDPATSRLSIRGLQMDMETDHPLLKTADKLLMGPLLNRLGQTLVFSVEKPLNQVADKLQDMRIGDHLRCDLTELDLKDIRINEVGLGVHGEVAGRCEVRLDLDPAL